MHMEQRFKFFTVGFASSRVFLFGCARMAMDLDFFVLRRRRRERLVVTIILFVQM